MSPLLQVPPSVIPTPGGGGGITIGSQLQALTGSWNGVPTVYGYQWQRTFDPLGLSGWEDIVGEMRSDYIVSAADAGARVSCLVTATNMSGSSGPARSKVVAVEGGNTSTEFPIWGEVKSR